LEKSPLFIFADGHQIDQVLMNFATNARDAMLGGGQFSIATEPLELDQDFITLNGIGRLGPHVCITVRDTGSGMDAQTAKKIFEPFFTTKDMGKGTGLGLSVVYGIIKEHEGHIKVESEPGKGTVFKVYLPLLDDEYFHVRDSKAQEKPKGGNETILLAEDELTVRKLFATVLEQKGYTVIEAEDGEDAIKKFEEYQEGIDMVIFDLIMPKMNGKQALESILKIQPDIKGMFISGYAPENIVQKDLLDLHMDVLYKPVSFQNLLRAVRDILDAR
jgi:CheY-like chemotaxis protein